MKNVELRSLYQRFEEIGWGILSWPHQLHIWFLKSLPSRIGLLVDMTLKDLERVLYFENFVVLDPGLTSLKSGQLLSEELYYDSLEEFGEDSFKAMIGAEAIHFLLSNINLDEESQSKQIKNWACPPWACPPWACPPRPLHAPP